MFSTVILSVFVLGLLILIHELGHFLFAKKFGVKVEEFGLFLPPRLWGKKIGETIYSINWIPFGGFVKMQGEDTAEQDDPRSFGSKPIWQRAIIIAAGVISFWIISVIITSGIYMSDAIKAVGDEDIIEDAQLMITAVLENSPASLSGLEAGDIIKSIQRESGEIVVIDKVAQVQELSANNPGEMMILEIIRGNKEMEISLAPRQETAEGKGAIGVALSRVTRNSQSFFPAIVNGCTVTWNMTIGVFKGWGEVDWGKAIAQLFKKDDPSEVQLVGPIGIVGMMSDQAQMGWNYYLQFVAMISVYLAVINALPIPALDGGRLMFLALEAIRRKPVPEKIEQPLTVAFYGLLMLLMVVVIIKDIVRLF